MPVPQQRLVMVSRLYRQQSFPVDGVIANRQSPGLARCEVSSKRTFEERGALRSDGPTGPLLAVRRRTTHTGDQRDQDQSSHPSASRTSSRIAIHAAE